MTNSCPTPDQFLEMMASKGYRVFDDESKNYNLNIIGFRNQYKILDSFNDILAIYWKYRGKWSRLYSPITTLPGKPWLLNPINRSGCAIVAPGQYLSCYKLGKYKGYTALRQSAPIKVFRDNTRDTIYQLDDRTLEEGNFGIHIHRAGLFSKIVGVSSAGCQVFQNKKDFEGFIYYCRLAQMLWGNQFSYTLLEL